VIVCLAWLILVQGPPSLDDNQDTLVKVWVAKKYLAGETVLTGSEFELKEVPAELVPMADNPLDIKGKTLLAPLLEGEILWEKDLKSDTEPQVLVTMSTDSLALKKGDKVAVMATKDDQTITLLDNLTVEDIKESQYDSSKSVLVATKEEEAQAFNLLKSQTTLTVVPSTGGLKKAADPLLAAKSMLKEDRVYTRKVEVIEGGVVTWHDVD